MFYVYSAGHCKVLIIIIIIIIIIYACVLYVIALQNMYKMAINGGERVGSTNDLHLCYMRTPSLG